MDIPKAVYVFSGLSWSFGEEERICLWSGVSFDSLQILLKQTASKVDIEEDFSFSLLFL